MPRIRDFDEYGDHATARRWLATRQRPWLRDVCNAIVAYAQEADAGAGRLTRLAMVLNSPTLLQKAYDLRHKAEMADYLLGLE